MTAVLGSDTAEPVLEVDEVDVIYPGKGWRAKGFQALRSVSLDVHTAETVGLVGESGSGKSTLGRAVLGLVPTSAGRIRFRGQDITNRSRAQRREMASDIQVVFQDPYTSFNPSMMIEDVLCEPLIGSGVPRREAVARVRTLLDQVQLPADAGRRYPSEFSGGQRQRIGIARALALEPTLIVCDEPVSALDLSTQAIVLDLLIELQERTGVAYLFISHDLAVVRYMSHRVGVMTAGQIIEFGPAATVTSSPTEPYTQRLLLASPVADPERQRQRREAFEAATLAPPTAPR